MLIRIYLFDLVGMCVYFVFLYCFLVVVRDYRVWGS